MTMLCICIICNFFLYIYFKTTKSYDRVVCCPTISMIPRAPCDFFSGLFSLRKHIIITCFIADYYHRITISLVLALILHTSSNSHQYKKSFSLFTQPSLLFHSTFSVIVFCQIHLDWQTATFMRAINIFIFA